MILKTREAECEKQGVSEKNWIHRKTAHLKAPSVNTRAAFTAGRQTDMSSAADATLSLNEHVRHCVVNSAPAQTAITSLHLTPPPYHHHHQPESVSFSSRSSTMRSMASLVWCVMSGGWDEM